jgi:hypothetical protein
MWKQNLIVYVGAFIFAGCLMMADIAITNVFVSGSDEVLDTQKNDKNP